MENNKLPDTQALETQEFCSEESIYDEDNCYLHVWAKLTYVPNKSGFELKYNESCFGRDVPPNSENMDVWIFNSQNCIKKYLERISKCHFQIEREALKDGDNDKESNMNPAFLTCHGRNGVYINEDKMSIGDRRILAHNDVIKLTKQHQLFIFQYHNLSSEINSLPKECVKKYYIGRTIGSGGCGVVRLIYNIKTFQKYAMKIIRKETNRLATTTIAYNAKILNEVKIMKSLSHPHVLSLVDCYESPDNVVIIMDYLEGKDMLHRITQYNPDSKRLTEMNAKFFFLQACRGLKYLHDSFITHRDIKPDNILLQSLSPDALLKISDFGLSKLIAADSMKTLCGTQFYVAPEIYYNKPYTNKVDIWSLGCVLFAMLSGSVPFCDAYGPPDVVTQIKKAKYSFKSRVWNDISIDAKDLIQKMLQKDPLERPSADEILKHPWLCCSKTVERVNRLYHLNDTLMNSSDEQELDLTMVNVTLSETDKSVMQPPPKRRRIE